jgi:hypothetical protein
MAAHVHEQGAVQSAIATQDPNVVDLDRGLGQIDFTIEEAAKRGRTDAVLSATDGRRKARQVLPGDYQREAPTLPELKAARAANGRQIEAEAVPIGHVAEPIGTDTDGEWAIRWLLALMVLSPAIAPTAA